jgi:hypothetical protein
MRIFVYGFSTEQVAEIDGMLRHMDFSPATVIRPDQGGAKVETILTGECVSADSPAGSDLLVLFHEFKNQDLDRFLKVYSAANLPQPIWAAVTDSNRHWTFSELLAALQKERHLIENGQVELDETEL